MALSNNEQTAIRAIIIREGGIDATFDQIRTLAIADKKAAAQTALGNAVSVTVSDWTAPAAFVAAASGITLPSVIADIDTAWAAKDQSKLGPLFVQLYAGNKVHFGR